MKFIKIKTYFDRVVYINPEQIEQICDAKMLDEAIGRIILGSGSSILVKETPEEIMEMIKEEK